MASRATETVEVDREALYEIARDLNILVVSLDRIGSYHPDDRAALERALTDFVIEWRVVDRLARARTVIADAVLGPNASPEQEEALGDSPVWEPKG
jgi:hypothetical protein